MTAKKEKRTHAIHPVDAPTNHLGRLWVVEVRRGCGNSTALQED